MMKRKKIVLKHLKENDSAGPSEGTIHGDGQLTDEGFLRNDDVALPRTVFIGGKVPPDSEIMFPQKFPDNRIITSKYTVWNFLPKNLFEQFRRIANLYFLIIAIIQITIDSPVSPLTSTAPLIFVVGVTAIKQAYEDWLRHRADNEVNKRITLVIQDGKLSQVLSKDIKVGDIILIRDEGSFPCDLVLLASDQKNGECHITTANLDGETNLKKHHATIGTRAFRNATMLDKIKGIIECEIPTADLYKFIGRLTLYDSEHGSQVFPLGPENILLRGSRLRNTKYIFGCAVYTGQDTKMALNSRMQSNKFSTIEKTMNIFLITFVLILLLEVIICTGLHYSFGRLEKHWYLIPFEKFSTRDLFQTSLSFLVLFNYIIPISMYVTIEFQKFLGSLFFVWDADLYDPLTNACAKCNTSDLNEELGQVNYLFTDKTGTLTENDMRFRQCSINGKRYIEYDDQFCEMSELSHALPEPVSHIIPEMEMFFLVLVLCHTVHLNIFESESADESDSNDNHSPEIQASSPDEKALVEACCRYGIVFRGMENNSYIIDYFGEVRLYQRLQMLEFSSERKCMSVIVKDEKGNILLLNKGAESSLMNKTLSGPINETLEHINDYAMMGLRTLVISYYKLTDADFQDYSQSLHQARISLDNRDKKIHQIYKMIENNLNVVGAVGVEDRLQDGVPETLESLRLAGIKVWILTGDKLETAVNISFSCGHFKRSMIQLKLVNQTSARECYDTLGVLHARIVNDRLQTYALVVDGFSLSYALEENCKVSFMNVCIECQAIICCRMSPLQKAEVVRLMKRHSSRPVTAAIGDGANDCSMIQEAHVGIGIMGKEGHQAVRCSDFAFARFKFLKKVLLVHGHFFYVRVSTLVQFFFYKNVAFITPQVYFSIVSLYSTQTLYDGVYLSLFNICFASLPILLYGLMEQNIPPKVLMDNPILYRTISKNARLSALQFIKWNILGMWHSLVFFFGTVYCFADVSLDASAQMLGLMTFGTYVFHLAVIVINLKLLLETRYITKLFLGSIILSIFGFVGFALLYNGVDWGYLGISRNLYWVYVRLISSCTLWMLLLLVIITALLPDILFIILSHHFHEIKKIFKWRLNRRLKFPLLSERTPLRATSNSSACQNTVYAELKYFAPSIKEKVEVFKQDDNDG